jgi:hypothetical protein
MIEAHGITTFCDDIRFEYQNKLSLIGCYGTDLLLHEKPPTSLPKLCALVSVRMPPSTLPKGRLLVFTPGQSDPYFVHDLPADEGEFRYDRELRKEMEADGVVPLRGFNLPLRFAPLFVQTTGFIKVRLIYDGRFEFKIGTLNIKFKEEDAVESSK